MYNNENSDQKMKQNMNQNRQMAKAQAPAETKVKSFGYTDVDFNFDTEDKTPKMRPKYTVLSPELEAAFMMDRSPEFMNILSRMRLSALSDDEIKRVIAREIVEHGASSVEEILELKAFSEVEDIEEEYSTVSEEEEEIIAELSDDDVEDILEQLAKQIEEAVVNQQLEMKANLAVLDRKAIDQSFIVTKCPISPSHDIHILPKDGHLFFCHLVRGSLTPVLANAKDYLYNKGASMVHVYQGCAFVINSRGEVISRIDEFDESLDLILKNGWEELP